MEGKTTFIYALCEPDTGEVRYIGKADRPKVRVTEHLREAKKFPNTNKSQWLALFRPRRARPGLIILQEVPHAGWQDAERYQIWLAKSCGVRLTNETPGGYERNYQLRLHLFNKGRVNSPETRAKISASNKGKRLSLEAIEKIRLANTGRKHSLESRQKISAARIGIKPAPFSEEHRRKLSEALVGHTVTQQTRDKIRMSRLGQSISKHQKEALLLANSGRKLPGAYSRMIGVSRDKRRDRWIARFIVDNHQFHLGQYESEIDAAIAYDWVAALFVRPQNFPNQTSTCTLCA